MRVNVRALYSYKGVEYEIGTDAF